MMLNKLLFSSCMAPIVDFVVDEITTYLGQRLDVPAAFVNEISWQEREKQFDQGQIHVLWLCGLPYVWKADAGAAVELLAAPVMQGQPYQGQPTYFSDVVVHQNSFYYHFEDLRGASWAYNEPRSHSGYYLTRYQLAMRNERRSFFGRIVAAGSHEKALAMIHRREIDAAAIDSTVLQMVRQQQPELVAGIRVIERWGPSPIPPLVIDRRVPEEMRHTLRALLLQMHEDAEGRAILDKALMKQFVGVTDKDYDPIRRMAARAAEVTLTEEPIRNLPGITGKIEGLAPGEIA